MRKLWLVAKHEYFNRVRQRSFWLSTLWIPAILVLAMGIGFVTEMSQKEDLPLGYVDKSGLLSIEIVSSFQDDRDTLPLEAFPDEATAREALEAQEILAFYVVPEEYLTTQTMTLYYWDDAPSAEIQDDFKALLSHSVLADLPAAKRQRVLDGMNVTLHATEGNRQLNLANPLSIVLPFVATFFFVFAVTTSAGYLLQAITSEKENRTIEVMVTSLTPEQLVGGKAMGLIGVTLTQLLIWVLTVVVGAVMGAQFFPELGKLQVPWSLVTIVILYFLPTYTLVAGMMTTISGMVTELRQGQQIAGIINLLFIFPVFLSSVVMANPNHPILVAATLFPTTSFITIAIRWPLAQVPIWQMIASWLILVTFALGSIWVAARVFRVGMLRYGQRLSLRHAIAALRQSRQ
jgi:ABC-2 type transport system permease protein